MAYEFRLPDIGEGLAEAEIVEWRVAVGDTVAMDEIVVDVETDKAVVEIPIPVAGTVLYLAEDQIVEVGAILVVIGEEGEVWPSEPKPETPSGDAAPIVGTLDTTVTTLSSRSDESSALPVVRKLAKEMGVDLTTVRGTGPHGRVTREDVLGATGETSEVHDSSGQYGRPLSRIRRAVADHMTRSWTEIPHVTAFAEVDATRLLEVKRALTKRSGVTVSIDALVAKGVVPALRIHPDFNARLDGDTVIDNQSFDIGLAVDTPDGLMVVTVRDVGSKSLAEVSSEIAALAAAAKERKATPDQRQTFTVSNIGALGGGYGTPIVPYGTTAILSVGRAVDKPVARDGAVVIAPMMPMSLTYDHRLIDGGEGRRFLALVIENLAQPALFLAD